MPPTRTHHHDARRRMCRPSSKQLLQLREEGGCTGRSDDDDAEEASPPLYCSKNTPKLSHSISSPVKGQQDDVNAHRETAAASGAGEAKHSEETEEAAYTSHFLSASKQPQQQPRRGRQHAAHRAMTASARRGRGGGHRGGRGGDEASSDNNSSRHGLRAASTSAANSGEWTTGGAAGTSSSPPVLPGGHVTMYGVPIWRLRPVTAGVLPSSASTSTMNSSPLSTPNGAHNGEQPDDPPLCDASLPSVSPSAQGVVLSSSLCERSAKDGERAMHVFSNPCPVSAPTANARDADADDDTVDKAARPSATPAADNNDDQASSSSSCDGRVHAENVVPSLILRDGSHASTSTAVTTPSGWTPSHPFTADSTPGAATDVSCASGPTHARMSSPPHTHTVTTVPLTYAAVASASPCTSTTPSSFHGKRLPQSRVSFSNCRKRLGGNSSSSVASVGSTAGAGGGGQGRGNGGENSDAPRTNSSGIAQACRGGNGAGGNGCSNGFPSMPLTPLTVTISSATATTTNTTANTSRSAERATPASPAPADDRTAKCGEARNEEVVARGEPASASGSEDEGGSAKADDGELRATDQQTSQRWESFQQQQQQQGMAPIPRSLHRHHPTDLFLQLPNAHARQSDSDEEEACTATYACGAAGKDEGGTQRTDACGSGGCSGATPSSALPRRPSLQLPVTVDGADEEDDDEAVTAALAQRQQCDIIQAELNRCPTSSTKHHTGPACAATFAARLQTLVVPSLHASFASASSSSSTQTPPVNLLTPGAPTTAATSAAAPAPAKAPSTQNLRSSPHPHGRAAAAAMSPLHRSLSLQGLDAAPAAANINGGAAQPPFAISQNGTRVTRRVASPASFFHAREIIPGLFLGSYSDATDPEVLAAHGISLVVNCSTECPVTPAMAANASHVRYMQCPLRDHSDESISLYFTPITRIIHEQLHRRQVNQQRVAQMANSANGNCNSMSDPPTAALEQDIGAAAAVVRHGAATAASNPPSPTTTPTKGPEEGTYADDEQRALQQRMRWTWADETENVWAVPLSPSSPPLSVGGQPSLKEGKRETPRTPSSALSAGGGTWNTAHLPVHGRRSNCSSVSTSGSPSPLPSRTSTFPGVSPGSGVQAAVAATAMHVPAAWPAPPDAASNASPVSASNGIPPQQYGTAMHSPTAGLNMPGTFPPSSAAASNTRLHYNGNGGTTYPSPSTVHPALSPHTTVVDPRDCGGVLVHCRMGVSRSATLVMAYLILYGCTLAATEDTASLFVRFLERERQIIESAGGRSRFAGVETPAAAGGGGGGGGGGHASASHQTSPVSAGPPPTTVSGGPVANTPVTVPLSSVSRFTFGNVFANRLRTPRNADRTTASSARNRALADVSVHSTSPRRPRQSPNNDTTGMSLPVLHAVRPPSASLSSRSRHHSSGLDPPSFSSVQLPATPIQASSPLMITRARPNMATTSAFGQSITAASPLLPGSPGLGGGTHVFAASTNTSLSQSNGQPPATPIELAARVCRPCYLQRLRDRRLQQQTKRTLLINGQQQQQQQQDAEALEEEEDEMMARAAVARARAVAATQHEQQQQHGGRPEAQQPQSATCDSSCASVDEANTGNADSCDVESKSGSCKDAGDLMGPCTGLTNHPRSTRLRSVTAVRATPSSAPVSPLRSRSNRRRGQGFALQLAAGAYTDGDDSAGEERKYDEEAAVSGAAAARADASGSKQDHDDDACCYCCRSYEDACTQQNHSSLRPLINGATTSAGAADVSKTDVLEGCDARSVSASAAAATPSSVMNVPRLRNNFSVSRTSTATVRSGQVPTLTIDATAANNAVSPRSATPLGSGVGSSNPGSGGAQPSSMSCTATPRHNRIRSLQLHSLCNSNNTSADAGGGGKTNNTLFQTFSNFDDSSFASSHSVLGGDNAPAMTFREAFDAVKTQKSDVNPNIGFVLALRELAGSGDFSLSISL